MAGAPRGGSGAEHGRVGLTAPGTSNRLFLLVVPEAVLFQAGADNFLSASDHPEWRFRIWGRFWEREERATTASQPAF